MQISSHPTQEQVQAVVSLYMEGRLQQALRQVSDLLRHFPDSGILYNIQGATHAGLGQFDAAVVSYNHALRINPDDAKTHYNSGMAHGANGNMEAAIASFENAVKIAPDYLLAYNGLGNALMDMGELGLAIKSYKRAVEIEPCHAEVLNNLGIAYKDAGKLEDAIDCFTRAIQAKPDYAEAYNNMGTAQKDKAELSQAITSYKQALQFNPHYVEATWNLAGSARDLQEAEFWIGKCLDAESGNQDALIARSILEYFKGNREEFDGLMKSALKDHPAVRSLTWVSSLPTLPDLYFNRWGFYDSVISKSVPDRPFYEFGVFAGASFGYLIKAFKKGFGFDTFEGLPEDWHAEKAGFYSSEGQVPDIVGGEFIVGKFEDTLPDFFADPRPLASVINFDADLYSSTLCALIHAAPVMDDQTILIFDEFIINDHWEQDEFKALSEFCEHQKCTFDVLAVSFFTKQVAVRLSKLHG